MIPVAVSLWLAATGVRADTASDAAEQAMILSVIDGFFLALYRADAEAFERLVRPQAHTVIVAPDAADASMRVRVSTRERTVAAMRAGTLPEIRESYWSPTILTRPRFAMVWAPYTIDVDGVFSHCGVDLFTLSKPANRWVIDAIAFTREPSLAACDDLGRPVDAKAMRPDFAGVK